MVSLFMRPVESLFRCGNFILFRNYAVKAGIGGKGGVMPTMEKKKLPVETDAKKLVNYVCGSNIYKEGEDIKLKPDSEYPDWLWSLNITGPKPLEELDPEDMYYWKRVHKINRRRHYKYLKTKKIH